MKKNCEKYLCKERAFKQVLIKDKKNKEYHWYCFDHHKEYVDKQKLECDWELCDKIGEFKAPSKNEDSFFQKLWNNAIEDELLFINKFKNSSSYSGRRYNPTQIIALKKMELDSEVNWSDIRVQFKKLVKKYHPDINAGNKQYEEKLKEITLAYTFLNNSINKNTEVA